MNPNYNILHSWIDNIAYTSPNVPNIFFGATGTSSNLQVSVDVQVQTTDTSTEVKLYIVSIILKVSPVIDGTIAIFDLTMTYSALTQVNDVELLTEPELYDILKVQIPQSLYDTARAAVWNITRESGCPPILLRDFNFCSVGADDVDSMKLEAEIDEYNISDKVICYASILKELVANRNSDLSIDLNSVNEYVNPMYGYEFLPSYIYLYQYLNPIEYHHPDFTECDSEIWDMLLQLLFGNGSAKCRIISNKADELPELAFTFEGSPERYISELEVDELKSLLLKLVHDSICNISRRLFDFKDVFSSSNEHLVNRPIILNEYKMQFSANMEHDSVLSNEVEAYYKLINDYFLQTFMYKGDISAREELF